MTPKPAPDVKNDPDDQPPVESHVAPPSLPSPTLDNKNQIPAGDLEVEKFLISTDTEGGD
ncbi:hypothetical protein BH11PLA2_BH11PLA2_27280 [soil metagenome]